MGTEEQDFKAFCSVGAITGILPGKMPKLTREEVLNLARLSSLELTDGQVEQYQNELGDILTYVEQLQSVDVSGLVPTYQVSGLTNSTRTDEAKEGVASPADLLKNAPKKNGDYIQVGRMI